ncbi:hypothetical protein SLH46_01660 [Draconibacterium sp. IB214405]|uniref:McrB family protein n=1 Tax=Draconibacterium sp. IB214405 TaxID=3097352 RepID=UPI002A166B27|nr:hypothetical protein [Draconibacterium sp. IB214405]MDX8337869.1 hypothetical protein [Draconibacterium sp. IB214405]
MTIPVNITKQHLTDAAEKILKEGIPNNAHSSTYDVLFNGELLPPKLVVSYANIFANGVELDRKSFKGGEGTECFKLLEENGFEIKPKKIGLPSLWFVCQGSTFTKDQGKKFLWAPKLDKDGKRRFHWENMKYVKKGDIIFNYSKGIKGISIAKNDSYESENIYEQSQWGREGYRIDIALYELERVIDISELAIRKNAFDNALSSIEKKPFNRNGGVNQGYLFEFTIEAAKLIQDIYGGTFNIPEVDKIIETVKIIKSYPIQNPNQMDLNYILPIKTKPFLILAGLSGTGKTRLVRQLAYQFCPEKDDLQNLENKPGNYELIKVKPNWHDSTELLGYVSQLSKKYISTPFVKFLAKAWKYKDVPFFVCLDEMNLAPVEQYFAEYLSVVETRSVKDGEIVTDALVDAKIFKDYDEEGIWDDLEITDGALKERFFEHGLALPPNLIVVGTVNMDETTHSFSRKVLDRAMTIEMNDINLEGNLYNDSELSYPSEAISPDLVLGKYTSGSQAALYLKDKGEEQLVDDVIDFLKRVNDALSGSPFQIAYRVRDEFLIYFANNRMISKEDSAEWKDSALDTLFNMKILPRIEGDEEKTQEPIEKLELLLQDKNFENSSKKLHEMKVRLEKYQYTSYWP